MGKKKRKSREKKTDSIVDDVVGLVIRGAIIMLALFLAVYFDSEVAYGFGGMVIGEGVRWFYSEKM